MQIACRILKILSDAKRHSAEALASRLQVHSSTVHESIRFLIDNHLAIDCVKGRGYRWEAPVELIHKPTIVENLSPCALQMLNQIDFVAIIPSTNDYLTQRLRYGLPNGVVCIAEGQSKGKGRMGRQWFSPFGANVYCSLYWHFEQAIHLLDGLPLVSAFAVIKAIEKTLLLPEKFGLKWPNDIYFQHKKLAGILTECFQSKTQQGTDVIIGIGINVHMPFKSPLDFVYTDLQSFTDVKINRNILIANLMNELVEALTLFAKKGFSAFLKECQRYDILRNKEILVLSNNQILEYGVGKGINERGELCYQTGAQIKAIRQGEVSIRMNQNVE